jgi:hypothetical protein
MRTKFLWHGVREECTNVVSRDNDYDNSRAIGHALVLKLPTRIVDDTMSDSEL